MNFNTQVEVVLSWFYKAPAQEQAYFKALSKAELIQLHHTLGRDIRNKLKLWEVPWEECIVDGIDVSENHPDAISMKIIEAVWSKVARKNS